MDLKRLKNRIVKVSLVNNEEQLIVNYFRIVSAFANELHVKQIKETNFRAKMGEPCIKWIVTHFENNKVVVAGWENCLVKLITPKMNFTKFNHLFVTLLTKKIKGQPIDFNFYGQYISKWYATWDHENIRAIDKCNDIIAENLSNLIALPI